MSVNGGDLLLAVDKRKPHSPADTRRQVTEAVKLGPRMPDRITPKGGPGQATDTPA